MGIPADLDEETGRRSDFAKDLYQHKTHLFRSWFLGLLMLCLLIIVLFVAFSDSDLSWFEKLYHHSQYHSLFNHSHQFGSPAYRVTPTHKNMLNTIHKSIESPALQSGGLQYHQAYPHNYQFVMDNTEVCKNNAPFLVLIVPVAPTNIAAREAIRQTWGKDRLVQGEVVITLFMLGLHEGADVEKLKQENEQHHDLIQSNFMDTYLNLTIKTMVIMDWLATHCPTAAYAMKVDSDMFLNINNLVIMLQKPGIPKLNYLTGMLMRDIQVIRSKNSKWYVPEEMYPDPKYPTYTLGMGYVFSNDLPAKFVEVSKFIKPFNIEDAYIGMCMFIDILKGFSVYILANSKNHNSYSWVHFLIDVIYNQRIKSPLPDQRNIPVCHRVNICPSLEKVKRPKKLNKNDHKPVSHYCKFSVNNS